MSILELFNNHRSAANERKDKELIRKTLYKDESFVIREIDKILNRIDGFLGATMDDIRHTQDPSNIRRRSPQIIKRQILYQLEPVFDQLDIDLEMEASNFENQFNPSVEDFVSYIMNLYNEIQPGINGEEVPEIASKIIDKETDKIWENLVRDKTGKRYSQQILLWWSRGSTAQNINEDLPAIVDSIKLFEKHRKSLPKNNISQYKRWDQLNEALEPIRVAEAAENRDLRLESGETVDELVDFSEEQIKFMDPKQHRFPDMDLEHPEMSGDVVVKKINTFEEAKALGEGTTWCFTVSQNYYNQYSGRGPLYIILDNGDPKVGIGVDYDWEIEIRNSNNGNLNSDEQKLYGPLVERVIKLEDMVGALKNRDSDEGRVIYECEYCEGEVWGYGGEDDPWYSLNDVEVCENCQYRYGCRSGDYEHGWMNSDGTFEDPRDEEVGSEIGSCWDCAYHNDEVSQCLSCKDIIFKDVQYHSYNSHRDNDNYFYSEELDGDLCEDCGIACSVCKEIFVNVSGDDELICNKCRQMEFPEVEQEPVYEQTEPDWEGEFFPQGDPNIVHYKALGE